MSGKDDEFPIYDFHDVIRAEKMTLDPTSSFVTLRTTKGKLFDV